MHAAELLLFLLPATRRMVCSSLTWASFSNNVEKGGKIRVSVLDVVFAASFPNNVDGKGETNPGSECLRRGVCSLKATNIDPSTHFHAAVCAETSLFFPLLFVVHAKLSSQEENSNMETGRCPTPPSTANSNHGDTVEDEQTEQYFTDREIDKVLAVRHSASRSGSDSSQDHRRHHHRVPVPTS